jgi:hypothetical protein
LPEPGAGFDGDNIRSAQPVEAEDANVMACLTKVSQRFTRKRSRTCDQAERCVVTHDRSLKA